MGTQKKDPKDKPLTPQKEKFSQNYFKTENGTASYRDAFNCANLKPSVIAVRACELLKQPNIIQRLKELAEQSKNQANIKFQITQETILQQLDTLRKSNIADYIEIKDVKTVTKTASGSKTTTTQQIRIKPFSKLTPAQLSCIEGVKSGRNGLEIKLHGKNWTLDMIAKNIGLYREDNEQKNKIFDSPEARAERISELFTKAAKLKMLPTITGQPGQA